MKICSIGALLGSMTLIIFCFLSGCTSPVNFSQNQTVEPTDIKYIQFQCRSQYIMFEYPKSWNFTSGCTNDWGGIYSLENPENNSKINIYIRGPVVDGVIQIEEWSDYQYNAFYDDLSHQYRDKIVLNKTYIGENPGLELYLNESAWTENGYYHRWSKTTIKYYRSYIVSYRSLDKNFDADYPIAKHVMDSFTFIEPDKSKTTPNRTS
jgi:hypothetical protein